MKGFDTAARLSLAQATALHELGYDFAIRYLVPPTSYKKALTKGEALDLSRAGLRIGLCWETTAARARDGAAAGLQDGQTARNLAQAMGVPSGAVIYFAVDYGAPAADYDRIAAYMVAAAAAVRPFRLGVYGSYYIVEEMYRRGIGAAYWQCVGWSGGKVSEWNTIYQREWNVSTSVVTVDNNYCDTPEKAGFFRLEEEPMIYTFTPVEMGIYVNSNKKSIDAIRKETGHDILANLNLFTFKTWTGDAYTRADGKVVGTDGYSYHGFGFDRDSGTFVRAWSNQDHHANFFGCCDIISGGKLLDTAAPVWTSGLKRRTVYGVKADGKILIYMNTSVETWEQMKAHVFAAGAVEAVCVDGSGSTQGRFPGGSVISSDGRPVHTLFWADLEAKKKVCPYKVPTGVVKYGTIGDGARCAQWMLVQAGYDIGRGGPGKDGIDGVFGAKCRDAVKAVQRKAGFIGADVDGKIGPMTWPVLKKEAGVK